MTNTNDSARNTFCTRLYEPPTTSSHTASAATGTETYFDTPNISMPLAMPANSENVVATCR